MRSRIIEGRLDGLDGGLVTGWAWKPSDPKLRPRLQVHIDGKFACEGKADRPRPDLREAGKGDGAYGFAFSIPERFMDGGAHHMAVVDVDTGTTLGGTLRKAVLSVVSRSVARPELASSAAETSVEAPRLVEREEEVEVKVNAKAEIEPKPVSPAPPTGGVLEGFKWGRLHGLAVDPQEPDRPALVEIRVDGLPEAIVRTELSDDAGGEGGVFAWKPGQHLVDGRTHEIRVRVLGEQAELEGSPAIIDFSPPPPVLKCHLAPIKGGKVWGWAWDKADPEARQEVQILIDGVPVETLVADEFNEALGRKGMGDSHHGFTWSIDRKYADGREHQIAALVRGVEISGSPALFVLEPSVATDRSVGAAPASGTVRARAPRGSLKGSLDAVTDLQIAGWAFDKAKPGGRLKVEIWIDGKVYAVIVADQFRRSLKERGLQDIRHGFVWTMDRRFADGRPHRLSVQVDGDDLTGSPVIFTLEKAKPLGLPPLTVSHRPAPVDRRAAFLSQTVLSLRREALRERQEFMAELAVLARATAEAESRMAQAPSDPELEALIKDMTAAVQSLGLKLARG